MQTSDLKEHEAPAQREQFAGLGSSSQNGAVPGGAPPMTASLMGRLFAVPFLIVSIIVACSVVVVLLFGSITTDKERPIAELMTVLKRGSGEKTAGVLLPGEKEVWQAARELALRLEARDKELTDGELESIAGDLASMLSEDQSHSGHLSDMGRQRMHYTIRALAKTGRPAALAPILKSLEDADPSTRREALAALGEMRDQTFVYQAIPRMIDALDDPAVVVRETACVALSAVGRADDDRIRKGFKHAYFDEDREVRWNAALAMARMSDAGGKLLLLDMLRRDYWESEVPVRLETAANVTKEYPMPAAAVEKYLTISVEAASNLADEDVWSAIRSLASDSSLAVRESVRRVESKRASAG